MKTRGFSIALFFLIGALVCTSCTKDEALLSHDEEISLLKGAKVKQLITDVEPSGDITGVSDVININLAIQNAGPGDIVQLGKGIFYLHKSIVCWDFSGTLRGAGMNETKILTAPGVVFDVSEDPPLEWDGNWVNEGHSMFSFPQHSNIEKRTVIVSDLTFEVNEPTTYWVRDKYNEATIHNTLVPVLVYHEGLDRDYSNTISLDVYFNNLEVIGVEDEQFDGLAGTNFSIATGLAAAGATVGEVLVEDVRVSNATFGLGLHVFSGENSIVTVTDSEVENARTGIYSSINRSWKVSDNTFENCALYSILLETYGLSGGTSLIEDNMFVMNEGRFGIVGAEMKNVQVADNIFSGSSNSGILTYLGADWTIIDNDFCDLSAPSSISLLFTPNCIVEDNAGQVVTGPSANDPSNYIGEAKECDN